MELGDSLGYMKPWGTGRVEEKGLCERNRIERRKKERGGEGTGKRGEGREINFELGLFKKNFFRSKNLFMRIPQHNNNLGSRQGGERKVSFHFLKTPIKYMKGQI